MGLRGSPNAAIANRRVLHAGIAWCTVGDCRLVAVRTLLRGTIHTVPKPCGLAECQEDRAGGDAEARRTKGRRAQPLTVPKENPREERLCRSCRLSDSDTRMRCPDSSPRYSRPRPMSATARCP